MPLFSAFTAFGGLTFSGRPSVPEQIYKSLKSSLGDSFDLTVGASREEATLYAQARGIGRAQLALVRAGNQLNPLKSVEMLPALERDWGIVPGEFDSILTRQKNVAAAQALLRGARMESLVDALTNLLGSNFVELKVGNTVPEVDWTDSASNFQKPGLPAKVATLLDPVLATGSTVVIQYAGINGNVPGFVRGDRIKVGGENISTAEVVTANVSSLPAGTTVPLNAFWATFAKPHDIGASCTTAPAPGGISTQRHVYVVVTSNVVATPVVRGQIHRLMSRILRSVTTWSIVTLSTATKIGPLSVGVSPMGTTTLQQINK